MKSYIRVPNHRITRVLNVARLGITKQLILLVLSCLVGGAAYAQTVKTFSLSWIDPNVGGFYAPGTYTNPNNPKETLINEIPVGGEPAVFHNQYFGTDYLIKNGPTYITGNKFTTYSDYDGVYKVKRTFNVIKGAKAYISTTMYAQHTAPPWYYTSLEATIDGMSLGKSDLNNSSADQNENPLTSIDAVKEWYPTSDIVTLELTYTVTGGYWMKDEQHFWINGFYQFTDAMAAANDVGTSVPTLAGGISVPNVLVNDTLGGNPIALADARLKQLTSSHAGVTLNTTTGAVFVTPGTPAGTYTLTYRVCQAAAALDGNCADATVTVTVTDPSVGIQLNKVLAGYRGNDKDQYTVQIKSGGVVKAEATTAGVGTVISQGTGVTSTFPAVNGVVYSVDEVMAAGSVTPLSQYTTSVSCKNGKAGGTDVSNIKNIGDTFTYATGDAISCAITNKSLTSDRLAKITLTKRLAGTGRVSDWHQFYFGIFNMTGGASVEGTTSGSGTTVSNGTVTLTVGRDQKIIMGEYNDGEGNPGIELYSTSMSCTNALFGGVDVSNVIAGKFEYGQVASSQGTVLGPFNGDDITCVMTNKPLLASMKVTQVIATGSGTGPFVFNYSGTNGWGSRSVSSASTGTPGKASADIDLTALGADTALTVDVKPGWKLVSASCNDTNGYYNGNSTATGLTTFGTVSNNTVTIPGANIKTWTALNCTVTLGLASPTLGVSKALAGGGRLNSKDQFTVQIKNSAGAVVGTTATATTTGSGLVIASGGTSALAATASAVYSLGEAMATDSVSALARYTPALACTNANPSGTDVSKVKQLSQTITPKDGDAISCVITNSPKVPTLKINQVISGAVPGVAPYTFDYSGTNGWNTINLSSAGVGYDFLSSSAVQPLGASDTDAAITPVLLPGWRVQTTPNGSYCYDNNNGVTGNTASTLAINITALGFTIPAALVKPGSEFNCVVGMELAPPTLVLSKAMGGTGRVDSSDQFVVQIKDAAGAIVGTTGTSGTSGSSTEVSGGISSLNATAGTAYTLAEAMADGSASRLTQYTGSLVCNNARTLTQGGTDVGAAIKLGDTVTPKDGDVISCVITNRPKVVQTVSGKVILDSGAGAGTAHDGIQNGTESGHSGVPLSLTNCTGTTYSTTTSAGDGSFSLSLLGVPANQAVCVVQTTPTAYGPVSVNAGDSPSAVTSTTANSTTLKFTPAADTAYSGIILGNAPVSTLTSDGAQQTPAGQTVTYAHIYTAGSAGSVAFATSSTNTPANTAWSSTLYLDANCSGTLDAGDTPLAATTTVTAGQQVCVLHRVFTPQGLPSGAQDTTVLTATETWSTTTLSPASQSHALKNTDISTISSVGLNLIKEVRKVGSCPATAAASLLISTVYAASGSAKPGDALEYRVRYSNNSAAPINSVKLFDAVPAYTQFKSAYCLGTPTQGISGCAVTQQPGLNATSGSVAWTLSDVSGAYGGLQPSDGGAVGFCITVQTGQ